METRSRKRAEASTSAALSGPTTRATKRSRLSATSAANAAAATPPISTRSRTATRSTAMDPNQEPSTASASTTRSRRGKNPSTNQNWENSNTNKDNTNSDKGKEKEPEHRHREAERSLGLNIDSHDGDDDDNDSEGGVGILHQNLTTASSALQGLLRKLGAGLDDLLPSSAMGSASSSHQSGRLKKILSGLRADGEEGKQVEALTQLCDMLSIGTEESLSTFSVDSFVPVLVGLLNHESNPDIMLFAARALTHLVDVLPSSCAAVVHYGAVSCFVARLLTIEYMDLAEQVFCFSILDSYYYLFGFFIC